MVGVSDVLLTSAETNLAPLPLLTFHIFSDTYLVTELLVLVEKGEPARAGFWGESETPRCP